MKGPPLAHGGSGESWDGNESRSGTWRIRMIVNHPMPLAYSKAAPMIEITFDTVFLYGSRGLLW